MVPTPDIPAFGPDRCAAYLEGTREAPARAQLLRALPMAPRTGAMRALDIGCGPGKEVVELLRAGFQVTAIDAYPSMIEHTDARVRAECPDLREKLILACCRLEDRAQLLPERAFSIVHAGFVLPFVSANEIGRTVEAVLRCIEPDGVFAGQFFGPHDEFVRTSPPGSMNCHSAGEARNLLAGFEILEHEEINRSGSIGSGRPKWWHVHHIVARKRNPSAC